ncbi:MFS transporter [Erwiniaceae bacterium BAC15a-03b]|uniref:MFS transporter n=1 Tax=Winslowiella arboricola TaxID=2978220 RepID=A0A9J6PS17_9GAMM|nr:MFS transporter [Winslowiella arboricola]MCU5775345.1 MFS transporter [Winslowiella arboricola]MCU5780258.1 MFS transporter [Winslowiella arboricola]
MINRAQEKPIGLKNMLAYGGGDVFGGGSFAVLGLWLMFFYTTYGGLSPAEAGAVIAIARLLDAFFDPLMGYVTDNFYRTRLGQRFGRRGFFFLLGAPLVFVSYVVMWISDMGFGYYLATYILFYAAYTLVIVPYETLAAEMTHDFRVRSRLTGVRMFFSMGAGILAAWLPGAIIALLGEDSSASFLYMGIIFATLFAIVIICLYLWTWERPIVLEHKPQPVAFKRDMTALFRSLLSTFKVRTFRQHVGMYLGAYVALDVLGAVLAYYIIFVLGHSTVDAANGMTFMSVVQFCCIAAWIPLCIRIGNGAAYKLAQFFMLASVALFISIYAFELPSALWLVWLAALIMGMGRSGTQYVCWNIYSFIPDVDEMLTGERREGIFAGVMTFVRKAVQAVALFIVGMVLQASGFAGKGAAVQPPEAVHGIALVFAVGAVVFLSIGVFSSLKFSLNRHNHALLIDEIQRRKQGGSAAAVTPEAQAVAEKLTGWPYQQLWGNNDIMRTIDPMRRTPDIQREINHDANSL